MHADDLDSPDMAPVTATTVTLQDAAVFAGVSERTLRRAAKDGEIAVHYADHRGGARIMIKRADLERWNAARTRRGDTGPDIPADVAMRQARQGIARALSNLQESQDGTHTRLDAVLEQLQANQVASANVERLRAQLEESQARVRELEALVEQLRARRWWQRS